MITCIFTLDYEMYGNGTGDLLKQIYWPTGKLVELFRTRNIRFVNFVEVAELEMIEAHGTDPSIALIIKQLRELYRDGFEIGLHVHPQWYTASYEESRWRLNEDEYNLCVLPEERMAHIIDRGIDYLKRVLNEPSFVPLCFRNSNWLFQPSLPLAEILVTRGVHMDSSVFKGGLQHKHYLDYRKALKNGYYWKFHRDVNQAEKTGTLLEMPTFTQMVFLWKLFDKKRLKIQQEASSRYPIRERMMRIKDFLRLRYPIKLDFCRLPFDKLRSMFEHILHEDQQDPSSFKPIVAIGHSKDMADYTTVELLLDYLQKRNIAISTFKDIFIRCS